MTRLRVFIDSSVLFAAMYSASGMARDLIRLGLQGQVQLIVSPDVLEETIRNLTRKAPEKVEAYQSLLELLQLEITADPAVELVKSVETYVVAKDAPIVAAAIQAAPDYLVTYDRKHLIEPPEVSQQSSLTIVTPAEVVRAIKNSDN